MARLARLLALACGLWVAIACAAGANPFGDRSDPAAAGPAQLEPAAGPLATVGRALLAFQRESNRLIAQHMRAIRDGETSLPLMIGLALAFTYGVVHALGPGHGKLVVASYFLAREARIVRGLLMGTQIAVCHVISAVVAVALADLLLRQAFGGTAAEVGAVRIVSYGLIALVGLAMLAQAVRRSRLRRAGIEVAGCCGHAHGPAPAGERERGARAGLACHDRRQLDAQADKHAPAQQGALAIGVGLVPCTGSVLILLYALANDILYAGMLLVAAIAAGMALTMGGLGILTVFARRAVAARVEASGGSGGFSAALDYAGALAITLLGGALLWSAL